MWCVVSMIRWCPHIEGSVDPVRDKEIVDLELQVRDLESVEKKIQRQEGW